MRVKKSHLYKVLVISLIVLMLLYLRTNVFVRTSLKHSLAIIQLAMQHSASIKPNISDPVILLWYKPFGATLNIVTNPTTCRKNITCAWVYDRRFLDQAAAVAYHFNEIGYYSMPFPHDRKEQQLHVWWSQENPSNTILANEYDNYFNMTMTYRRDSDIYYPYGTTTEILDTLSSEDEYTVEELLERKRQSGKMAVWVVSNCEAKQRMKLTKELESNGVTVDKYGKCFEDGIDKDRYSKEFFEKISKYKFYFSFENRYHCKDYITEKFWSNGLRAGAVPVVLGAKKEDILKVAPTKSFIHVDDFASVKELAHYLKYLSINETAYAAYLEWRNGTQNLSLLNPHLKDELLKPKETLCKLCEIVTEIRRNISLKFPIKNWSVKSIEDHWFYHENSECFKDTKFAN